MTVLAVTSGLAMLVLVAAGALAWRLSEAPLDVTWLLPHLAPAGWGAGQVTLRIVPDAAGTGHDLHVVLRDGERGPADGLPAQSVRAATAAWRWRRC